MNKVEFQQSIKRLALAFDKTLNPEMLDLWWNELQGFSLDQICSGVQFFLDTDQKSFPRIGEFKIAIKGKERRLPEGSPEVIPSCSRCQHGFCSVVRWKGDDKANYTFRCSCPSGDRLPGLPLIDPNEETVKERRRRTNGEKPHRGMMPSFGNLGVPFPQEEEIPF